MSKSKEVAKNEAKELAISDQPMPWVMEGADDSDKILPLAVIMQEPKKQRDKLGDHPEGSLVDSSTQERIEEELFAPIFGYKEYIAWKDRKTEGGGIRHRTRDLNEVPAGGLEWSQDENGNPVPPEYTTHRNFFVMFKGASAPVVLSFKSSSKYQTKCGKLINTMMIRRSAMKQGPAFFKIKLDEVKNDQGQWFEPFVTFSGPCDEETAKAVFEWSGFVAHGNVDSNIEQAEDGDAPF